MRFGDCDSARAESPYISEQVAVFYGASPPPRIRVRLASLAWCVCPLSEADCLDQRRERSSSLMTLSREIVLAAAFSILA